MTQNPHYDIDKYFAIQSEKERLEGMQLTASAALRPAIDQAIGKATQISLEMEADPLFLETLSSLGNTVMNSLKELDELAEAVELGLIDGDIIESQRRIIESDERNQRVLGALQKLGVVNQEVTREEVTHNEKSQHAALTKDGKVTKPETDSINPPVEITIHRNGVQLGKKGRFVKLSGTTHEGQRDYSEERKAVLKVLVEHAGSDVTVRQLWKEAFGTEEVDKDVTRQVKYWLDTLTFRRKPLVVHNNKRGPSSAYSIPNPNVTITELTKTQKIVSSTSRKISEEPKSQAQVSLDVIHDTPKNDKISKETVAVPVIHFPLNRTESLVLGEFLEFRAEVLKEFDIPTIDVESALSGLKRISKTSDIAEALVNYKDVHELRKSIIEKVNDYFEQDEVVLDDLVNMSEKDHRYELFQYLFGFDEEQRKFLLEKLCDAIPSVDYTEHAGSFSSGRQIIAVQTGLRLPNGEMLGRGEVDDPTNTTRYSYDDESEQDAEISVEPIGDSIDSDHTETTSTNVEASPSLNVQEAAISTEKQEFDRALDIRIQEILLLIDEYSMDGKNSKTLQGVDGMGFLSSRFVRNASENGLIDRNSKLLSTKDIVLLTLFKDYQSAFSIRSSTKKPDKRQIDAAMRRAGI